MVTQPRTYMTNKFPSLPVSIQYIQNSHSLVRSWAQQCPREVRRGHPPSTRLLPTTVIRTRQQRMQLTLHRPRAPLIDVAQLPRVGLHVKEREELDRGDVEIPPGGISDICELCVQEVVGSCGAPWQADDMAVMSGNERVSCEEAQRIHLSHQKTGLLYVQLCSCLFFRLISVRRARYH